jgi:glycosyltransferase involved in cell wall biosynthesis
MNILLITTLYPKSNEESIKTTSFAIKELVAGLESFNVFVKKIIIPIPYMRYRELKANRERITVIDSIPVEVKTFCNIPKIGLSLCAKNKKYFKQELKEVDLVVAHMREGAKIADRLYSYFSTPYIYILHNSDLQTLDEQKNIFRRAKSIYSRSWSMQKRLEDKGIKVDGVVFSGIEKELILDKEYRKNNKRSFISVNLLQKLKNIDVTIKALSLLPKELVWEYTIIGDGEEYGRLNSLVEELKLEDRVKFLGFKERKECIEYMKKSDVFLMPSSPETFGLAYLEAMASGCLIVCAKGWGVDGLIQNSVNGYSVTARDVNELSTLLEQILTTDQSSIYKKSLKTIKRYTLTHAQRNYAKIIESNRADKIKYQEFCHREKNISIFLKAWWLDTVCGKENWDVVLIEKGGNISAFMPYLIYKRLGLVSITHPLLTQTMGIYFNYPKNQKYYKKLSFEKEMIEKIIKKLPLFDRFSQSFHYTYSNFLPFTWNGFNVDVNYTYVIEKDKSLEDVEKNLETDIRRRRKKSQELGIEVYESEDIEKFYELNKMTFKRQKREIPYSFDFIKRLHSSCKEQKSCKMFFARDVNHKVLAVNFLIYDTESVYYLMGGIDPNKKELGAMDAILFESITFALKSGKVFDFEGSMVESIEKYFRSFGAVQKPYFTISKNNSKLLKSKMFLKEMLQ